MKNRYIWRAVVFLMGAAIGMTGCGGPGQRTEEQSRSQTEAQTAAETPVQQTEQPAQTTAPEGVAPARSDDVSITEEAAKAKALEHAGLAESDVTFIKAEKTSEDGWPMFEVSFYNEHTEYEYDIDGATGEIHSFEQEARE